MDFGQYCYKCMNTCNSSNTCNSIARNPFVSDCSPAELSGEVVSGCSGRLWVDRLGRAAPSEGWESGHAGGWACLEGRVVHDSLAV
eukprot:3149423-Pyramimonas_sp.AAC.1